MNKKEISEIKKQLTPENCALTRLCACYVDGEKNKKSEMKEAFLSQSEEECFKYFEIFRKSLSGTVGKNLINLEFPLDAEMEGGAQEFLMRLKESRLKDDELLEEFYDRIIESFDYGENYLILLVHGAYDIPGKSSDNEEMFDACLLYTSANSDTLHTDSYGLVKDHAHFAPGDAKNHQAQTCRGQKNSRMPREKFPPAHSVPPSISSSLFTISVQSSRERLPT